MNCCICNAPIAQLVYVADDGSPICQKCVKYKPPEPVKRSEVASAVSSSINDVASIDVGKAINSIFTVLFLIAFLALGLVGVVAAVYAFPCLFIVVMYFLAEAFGSSRSSHSSSTSVNEGGVGSRGL